MKHIKNKELIITITIYLIIAINIMIKNISLYTNIINPIFWGLILIYVICNMKKWYVRFCENRKYFIIIIIISCIHVVAYFYLGFIFGFSKSPYSHEMLKNIIEKIFQVIGIEIVRAVIINRNKNNKKLTIFLTIILMLLEINYNTLVNIYPNKEELFKYICSTVLPIISYGCLYTYLALKGSYSLSLTYKIFKEFVSIILPIIPNIDWFIRGSSCILSSILIYLLFKYKFTKEKEDIRKKQKNLLAKWNYIIAITLSILLIFFMLGVFKYEPIAILSNSMMPIYNRGDVIIYKKLDENELKKIPKNSIIIYSIGEQNIAHRIIDVIEEDNITLYQTKGDNNNVEDPQLVTIDQIKGVYIFKIKYIGFPSVFLHEYFNQ